MTVFLFLAQVNVDAEEVHYSDITQRHMIMTMRGCSYTMSECYYHMKSNMKRVSRSMMFTGQLFVDTVASDNKILQSYTKSDFNIRTMSHQQRSRTARGRALIIGGYSLRSDLIIISMLRTSSCTLSKLVTLFIWSALFSSLQSVTLFSVFHTVNDFFYLFLFCIFFVLCFGLKSDR